jgi:hypothetical protein
MLNNDTGALLTYYFTPTYGQPELEDVDCLYPLDHPCLDRTSEQLGSLRESKRAKSAPYTMYEIIDDTSYKIGDYFIDGDKEGIPEAAYDTETPGGRKMMDIKSSEVNGKATKNKKPKNGRKTKTSGGGPGIQVNYLQDENGEETKSGVQMQQIHGNGFV